MTEFTKIKKVTVPDNGNIGLLVILNFGNLLLFIIS